MQEISELLIKARNEKGIDLDQAVQDTNISKTFLQGLESDNYSDFPAETYVLGFLRNYAAYLGLDPEEVVRLYKQTKLQESEIPAEVMLNKKPVDKKLLLIVIGVIAGIAIIAGVTVMLLSVFRNKQKAPKQKQETTAAVQAETMTVVTENEPMQYTITEDTFQNRLFEGDSFIINVDNVPHTFKVTKAADRLELETEQFGKQILNLTETIQLDLNNDAVTDIEITLNDITADAKKGALLTIEHAKNVDRTNADILSANSNTQNYTVVFESATAYPVIMNITFKNYCFFRYEIDKANRKENYYQKNDSLSIRADNGFRIWASNGNATKIDLVGAGRTVSLKITKPGEVIVQDIKWIKDDQTNLYKFVVVNVD